MYSIGIDWLISDKIDAHVQKLESKIDYSELNYHNMPLFINSIVFGEQLSRWLDTNT